MFCAQIILIRTPNPFMCNWIFAFQRRVATLRIFRIAIWLMATNFSQDKLRSPLWLLFSMAAGLCTKLEIYCDISAITPLEYLHFLNAWSKYESHWINFDRWAQRPIEIKHLCNPPYDQHEFQIENFNSRCQMARHWEKSCNKIYLKILRAGDNLDFR